VADDVWAGLGIWAHISEVGGILSSADGFWKVGFVWVLRGKISGVAGVVRYWLCGWNGYLVSSVHDDASDETVCGNLGGGGEKPQKSGFHHRRHFEQVIVAGKKLVEKEWISLYMITGLLR